MVFFIKMASKTYCFVDIIVQEVLNMDIAALAMNMSQTKLMQDVSLAVTKQAMDMQETQTTQLIEMLDAPHPTAGHNFDVQV